MLEEVRSGARLARFSRGAYKRPYSSPFFSPSKPLIQSSQKQLPSPAYSGFKSPMPSLPTRPLLPPGLFLLDHRRSQKTPQPQEPRGLTLTPPPIPTIHQFHMVPIIKLIFTITHIQPPIPLYIRISICLHPFTEAIPPGLSRPRMSPAIPPKKHE